MNKLLRKILITISSIILLVIITTIIINLYIHFVTKDKIKDNLADYRSEDKSIILVLGCSVKKDKPSPLLKHRLDKALELYNKKESTIILSGDYNFQGYDEVTVMYNYMLNNNVKEEDLIKDFGGFSTYDSIYRLKNYFKKDNVIIVTQKYHLKRALYIAEKLGLNAIGYKANDIKIGQSKREFREILARNKDFIMTIFKPESKIMTEK